MVENIQKSESIEMKEKTVVRTRTVENVRYVRIEDVCRYLLTCSDGETNEIREWAESAAQCFERLK